MAITGIQIVEDALYQCGALGQGDNLNNDDAQLVLRRLNRMLDSWANLKQMIYAVAQETFTMVVGQVQYSSALLATGRPVAVDSIFVRLNTIDYPVELVDSTFYDSLSIKSLSGIPAYCYVDPQFPTMLLNFYAAPYAAFTAYVSTRRVLSGAITTATSVALPPGYEKSIVDALAVDIAPSFGRAVTPDMRDSAKQAMIVLKMTNYTPQLMATIFDSGDYVPGYIRIRAGG